MENHIVIGGLQRKAGLFGMPRTYAVVMLTAPGVSYSLTQNPLIGVGVLVASFIAGKIAGRDGGVKAHIAFLHQRKCMTMMSKANKDFWKSNTYDPF